MELGLVESLSHETVRLHLKRRVQAVAEATVAHPESRRGVRCGNGRALWASTASPMTPRGRWSALTRSPRNSWRKPERHCRQGSGRPKREDYEYLRAGTRNLLLTCVPPKGWRHVAITKRRTMQDFAHQMRWLVDEAYPDVPVIRVVLHNLNTHRIALRDLPAV